MQSPSPPSLIQLLPNDTCPPQAVTNSRISSVRKDIVSGLSKDYRAAGIATITSLPAPESPSPVSAHPQSGRHAPLAGPGSPSHPYPGSSAAPSPRRAHLLPSQTPRAPHADRSPPTAASSTRAPDHGHAPIRPPSHSAKPPQNASSSALHQYPAH